MCAPAGDDSDRVHIEVRDTGEGIAADELPRIFDLYRQAESRQRVTGVGLGLAIVKRIVEAHGGVVAAGKAPGGGAEFVFTLPRSQP